MGRPLNKNAPARGVLPTVIAAVRSREATKECRACQLAPADRDGRVIPPSSAARWLRSHEADAWIALPRAWGRPMRSIAGTPEAGTERVTQPGDLTAMTSETAKAPRTSPPQRGIRTVASRSTSASLSGPAPGSRAVPWRAWRALRLNGEVRARRGRRRGTVSDMGGGEAVGRWWQWRLRTPWPSAAWRDPSLRSRLLFKRPAGAPSSSRPAVTSPHHLRRQFRH